MAGEDFACVLQVCTGACIRIGNGDTADPQHPEYNFSDDVIPAGASYWVELAEARVPAV